MKADAGGRPTGSSRGENPFLELDRPPEDFVRGRGQELVSPAVEPKRQMDLFQGQGPALELSRAHGAMECLSLPLRRGSKDERQLHIQLLGFEALEGEKALLKGESSGDVGLLEPSRSAPAERCLAFERSLLKEGRRGFEGLKEKEVKRVVGGDFTGVQASLQGELFFPPASGHCALSRHGTRNGSRCLEVIDRDLLERGLLAPSEASSCAERDPFALEISIKSAGEKLLQAGAPFQVESQPPLRAVEIPFQGRLGLNFRDTQRTFQHLHVARARKELDANLSWSRIRRPAQALGSKGQPRAPPELPFLRVESGPER